MDLEMVLNELSLHPLASNEYEARQRMTNLVGTMVTATTNGVKRTLRTQRNFAAEELASGYPVARWLKDAKVDRDSQRFFRGIVTKSSFLAEITQNNIVDISERSEYFWEEKPALGLGAAYVLDALALSLPSDPCWNKETLQLKITQLGDDSEIIDTLETIHHASLIDHVRIHLPWINQRLRTNARSNVNEGADIWLYKKEWFPHLYFCEQTKRQLQMIDRGHVMLKPVLTRLYELEHYCAGWLDGPFDHSQIVSKATPESEATLKTYSSEHTFRCHDGTQRLFTWHLRMTPGAWRLYFYPLPEEHKIIVGYIGRHLATKLYSH